MYREVDRISRHLTSTALYKALHVERQRNNEEIRRTICRTECVHVRLKSLLDSGFHSLFCFSVPIPIIRFTANLMCVCPCIVDDMRRETK